MEQNTASHDSPPSPPATRDASGVINHTPPISFKPIEVQGVISLLDFLLGFYCESIQELKRANAKNELCHLLVNSRLIPSLFLPDELLPEGVACSQLISNLVKSVILKAQTSNSLHGVTSPATVFSTQSRFRSEFEKVSVLGRGGFGVVHRVKSLIDKNEYAIKRIAVPEAGEQHSQTVLREIQTLAQLHHPNIVRYHAGWIEVESGGIEDELTNSCTRNSDTQQSTLPSIMEDASDKVEEKGGIVRGVGAVTLKDVADDEEMVSAVSENGTCFTTATRDCTVSTSSSTDDDKEYQPKGRFWRGGKGDTSTSDDTEEKEAQEKERWNEEGGDEKRKEPSSALVHANAKAASKTHDVNQEIQMADLPLDMVINIQMELCASTLEILITKRNYSLDTSELRGVDGAESQGLFRQLCSAIEYCHERGIIHRDIKPANLFVTPDGGNKLRLKLGDFGLCCMHSGGVLAVEGHSVGVGTCSYAAPEQLTSNTYGPAVDVYSAGIVLLELFHVVQTESERVEVISALRTLHSLPSSTHNEWPSVSALILQMTESECKRRPSASNILSKLNEERECERRPSASDILSKLNEEGAQIHALQKIILRQKREIRKMRSEIQKMKRGERAKSGKKGLRFSSTSFHGVR